MVAVACSQCGEYHHAGYAAPPAGSGSSARSEEGPVWDVAAVPVHAPTGTHPAPASLAVPVRRADVLRGSVSPRMRTSATYTNGTSPGHPAPKALLPGRPAPASPPSPPPDTPGGAHREPSRPRRPLVQIIQEVLSRSGTHDLEPGTSVVVRNRFNGRWTPGFAVHEALETGYRIRRSHTGAVLPTIFKRSDVAVDGSGPRVGAQRPDRAAACASV